MKSNRALSVSVYLIILCCFVQAGTSYIHGIDVSHWQGSINWSSVADSGKDFAFMKATEGVSYVDPKYFTNITRAHARGLWAGSYHFATPFTGGVMDAATEATHFASTISPYLTNGYFRSVLDLESGSSYGKAALSNWVNTFMATMVSLTDIEPIIYCNSYYANNFFNSSISQYDLWIARWTYDLSIPPTSSTCGIWSDWSFWQYSDSGTVTGISGAVDLDVFKGDDITAFLIPEPATLMLMSLGAVLLKRKQQHL